MCINSLMFWILVTAFLLGGVVSWAITKPDHPWMTFTSLTATHTSGSMRIDLGGVYDVDRKCPGKIIWRSDAIHPDGTVISSAPTKGWPNLRPDTHIYDDAIILPDRTPPTDWRVIVTVSCLVEQGSPPLMVASPEVRVIFLNQSLPSPADGDPLIP